MIHPARRAREKQARPPSRKGLVSMIHHPQLMRQLSIKSTRAIFEWKHVDWLRQCNTFGLMEIIFIFIFLFGFFFPKKVFCVLMSFLRAARRRFQGGRTNSHREKRRRRVGDVMREEVRWRRAGNDRSFVTWWALARLSFSPMPQHTSSRPYAPYVIQPLLCCAVPLTLTSP